MATGATTTSSDAEDGGSLRERPVLPPLRTILKSRDVEDPVNLWVHRPLAYGFVAAIYRSSVTPNQVTLFALLLGVAAAVCWVWGTPAAMVAGGILIWSSAIADGADGLLARAQKSHSLFGRALDGSADAIVAVATMAAVIWHLWTTGYILEAVLTPIAIVLTLVHLQHYDFFKELYLGMTRTDGGHDLDDPDEMERLAEERPPESVWVRLSVHQVAAPYLRRQQVLLGWTNPLALRLFRGLRVSGTSEEAAVIYRTHNRRVMKLWSAVSLAPHTYLLAIFAIMNSVFLYLWVRLVIMNVLFVILLLWQRNASQSTLAALERAGHLPVERL